MKRSQYFQEDAVLATLTKKLFFYRRKGRRSGKLPIELSTFAADIVVVVDVVVDCENVVDKKMASIN